MTSNNEEKGETERGIHSLRFHTTSASAQPATHTPTAELKDHLRKQVRITDNLVPEKALQEALTIQQNSAGSFKGDLDLLHTATVMSNCGYLNLCLKMYDEARTHFEEALLIQQSVLDDHHRAVRDTLR